MGVKPPFTRKMGGEYSPQLAKEEQLSVGASGDCSPTTLHFVPSSKGRTSDFDSDNGGSNPSGTTIICLIDKFDLYL
jgi:hypothetical protein